MSFQFAPRWQHRLVDLRGFFVGWNPLRRSPVERRNKVACELVFDHCNLEVGVDWFLCVRSHRRCGRSRWSHGRDRWTRRHRKSRVGAFCAVDSRALVLSSFVRAESILGGVSTRTLCTNKVLVFVAVLSSANMTLHVRTVAKHFVTTLDFTRDRLQACGGGQRAYGNLAWLKHVRV